ncbi:rhamnosyltransferase WsaF family glycosyltransferase [Oryzifoliimicrobium ureilyticus]|uniref:rhamnosyltransferase WsaF family glycosyltransferase n=1 Tax=Oryzifoliimicrobium ureilyticus TaxID=3113724 RepID=UPI0030761DFE
MSKSKLINDIKAIYSKRGLPGLVASGIRDVAFFSYNMGVWLEKQLFRFAASIDPKPKTARLPRSQRANSVDARYEYTHELQKCYDGVHVVVPSRRPTNKEDYAFSVPFSYKLKHPAHRPVAVIIHCFYVDLLQEIISYISNIPGVVDIFISTDSLQKADTIKEILRRYSRGNVTIRVFPNRGRDVAPLFVGFRDVYEHYDLFLHLHTKKSPHGGEGLVSWREYLFENLCGSEAVVQSVFELFQDPTIGVVFPQHLFELRGALNWGYDFEIAKALLEHIGVKLDKDRVLEFPSGSMFWARSAAVKKLLDLDLKFDDFPAEEGQIDGTLAHAIERSLLIFAEAAGFEWRKIVQATRYPMKETVLPVSSPGDLSRLRSKVYFSLLETAISGVMPSENAIPETRALLAHRSNSRRRRINLVVPTINPSQTFGGVSTALKVFDEISDALGSDFDRRIIVTCAPVKEDALLNFPAYKMRLISEGSVDEDGWAIVDAFERSEGKISLRDGDVFIATAWWTAAFSFSFNNLRRLTGKSPIPVIYLIQDNEPYFYGWSTRWALAEATYRNPDETIAIINSAELALSISSQYTFRSNYYLPYTINAQLEANWKEQKRERIILIYGRPNVLRNAFEILADALILWQRRNPTIAAAWSILSLGEEFDPDLVFPMQNLQVIGKASLEKYAEYLSTASVGVSLMLSPHPSYPPQEMAEAGLITVTNKFNGKNIGETYSNIIEVDLVTAEHVADAVEKAVQLAESNVGHVVQRARPNFMQHPIRQYAPERVASEIKHILDLSTAAK